MPTRLRLPLPFSGLIVLATLVTPVAARQPANLTRLTPERAIDVRRPMDLQWSPDGNRLAFTIAEPPKGAERRTHIWIRERASGVVRQFTSSAKSERQPRWSPDGRTLAFLSDRGDETQIYLLRADGGEAWPLTTGKNSVRTFEWSPDGTRIAFLAPEAQSDAEKQRAKDKADARVVDFDEPDAHLWTVDVTSGAVTGLIGAPWEFDDVRWFPDGKALLAVATDRPASDQWTNRIYRIDADAPVMKSVAAPSGPFGDVRVSKDGRQIAYIGARVDGPDAHDLYALPLDGSAPRNLTATPVDRPVIEYVWSADGSFLVNVEQGFRSELWTVSAAGQAIRLGAPGLVARGLAPDPSGAIWFVGETATQLPELTEWSASAGPALRSHVNEALTGVRTVTPELVTYKTFDGRQIEAALLTPAGRPKTPLPTVVLIHGGPTGAWRDTFDSWGQLLATAGYAVFSPNVRGSTGYGYDFMVLNRADWGGGDFKDVMAGVDWLVSQHIADPSRLGIAGWSYGGYMASWAITQTTRFKAAVTGAGMSDLAAEFGTERGPAYDEWFYGLPYERPEGFRKSSPLTYITKARTPTLILQGEEDVTDPIGQSQALYRALKRYGVETELVLYPREGHGLREEKHLVDRLTRIVGWFDRHLQ
jgi:dipeptidyl aminopeptidase/acylaminoacyl peptidase